ncbi:uncharacterized protein JCM10292_004258 [Rhodotorula paludigena]|uniref:uncharacterized protein n=1 Tax=Rhodotorula paludigena TaxID=86838 RepID=UPI003181DA4A
MGYRARSRPGLLQRRNVLLGAAAVLVFTVIRYLVSSAPPYRLPRPIVSLTSTPDRVSTSLAPTVWSLLRQSLPPEAIHVYLPRSSRDASALLAKEPVFQHPLVSVRYVQDEGPATKFLAVLREAYERARTSPSVLDHPLLVLDDDHVYSSALVESLIGGWVAHGREAAVALRGWRVREDLQWGVAWADVKRHVVEGWRLRDSYQVGVITAHEGYIVTPGMFLPAAIRARPPPTTSSLASVSPIFSYAPPTPPAAHLVDDIWLSGTLAAHSIPRFVVPLRAPEPPSVDITRGAATAARQSSDGGSDARSPLEKHLAEHGQSRKDANDETLRWFGPAWALDRELVRSGKGGAWVLPERTIEQRPMWYDSRGADERRKSGSRGEPVWAGPLSRARSRIARWALYRRARSRWGNSVLWN